MLLRTILLQRCFWQLSSAFSCTLSEGVDPVARLVTLMTLLFLPAQSASEKTVASELMFQNAQESLSPAQSASENTVTPELKSPNSNTWFHCLFPFRYRMSLSSLLELFTEGSDIF